MSVIYCPNLDKAIDLDTDLEHLETCNACGSPMNSKQLKTILQPASDPVDWVIKKCLRCNQTKVVQCWSNCICFDCLKKE